MLERLRAKKYNNAAALCVQEMLLLNCVMLRRRTGIYSVRALLHNQTMHTHNVLVKVVLHVVRDLRPRGPVARHTDCAS
jgi:chorismate mutase